MFKAGKNYSGQHPKPAGHPFLRAMLERLCAPELESIPNALIIPLGKAVEEGLDYLSELGLLRRDRWLRGFPHPSASNAHRKSEFERARADLQWQIEAWFSRLADDTVPPDSQLAARARGAWFASGLHREWPTAFLDPAPPEALVSAVRSVSLQAGPALEFSSLIRAEVDYGAMEDIAEGTWQQFSWAHVLRAFVIWVVIFFAAYGAYLHFFHQR